MRVPDWERRLNDVVATYQGGTFVWGERDCLLLPVMAADAVSGSSLASLVPAYRTGLGAALELRRRGFSGVGDAIASRFPEILPSLAGRGDIGVVVQAGVEAGVVVLGAQIVGIAKSGLSVLPRARLYRAFKVG